MNLETQKKRLFELRAEYAANLEAVRSRNRDHEEYEETATLSDIPTAEADVGTETFEREMALSFTEDFQGMIDQIDRALQKIEEGTYGICDRCGERIPEERLEAAPQAILCIKDQEIEEGL